MSRSGLVEADTKPVELVKVGCVEAQGKQAQGYQENPRQSPQQEP